MDVRSAPLPNDAQRMRRRTRLKIPVEFVMRNVFRRRTIENGEIIVDRGGDDGQADRMEKSRQRIFGETNETE